MSVMQRLVILAVVFALMVFSLPSQAAAQKQLPQSREQIQLSYAPVVKQTAPAVVNIYTQKMVQQRASLGLGPFMNDPFFRRFFGQELYGMPMRKRLESSLGSGVIVAEDGLIVSNAHVIKDAQEIVVVTNDGQEYQAQNVLVDERTDLAVLKIDTEGRKLPVIRLGDSDRLEVGDIVLAIGNPFGVGQTVTSGIVSAVARTAAGISDYNFFIQTDAAINPGNSGGALVGLNGRLIGVNTAIFSRDGGSLGIGFAIPSNMVQMVIDAARSGGELRRSWFGVGAQGLTSDIAQGLGLDSARGALITGVHPASPAAKAGLKTGDVVTHLNGKQVEDPVALRFRAALVKIGDKIVLDIVRKGKKSQISFAAIAPPENPPRNETALTGAHPLTGTVVANISPAVLEDMGDSKIGADSGVVITNIRQPSRLGLQAGDVVQQINGVDIKTVRQLTDVLRKPARVWNILIGRGGQVIQIRLAG
jgi:serine protease Do